MAFAERTIQIVEGVRVRIGNRGRPARRSGLDDFLRHSPEGVVDRLHGDGAVRVNGRGDQRLAPEGIQVNLDLAASSSPQA